MTSCLTDKQRQLIQTFDGLILQYHIRLDVDVYPSMFISPISLDIEHDEEGGLVGIGVWANGQSYYYTIVTDLLRIFLTEAGIVAHNGISDFECLRQWGIPVKDEQLVWDTYLIGHIQDSSLKAYGLKDMAKRELGIEYPSYDDIVGKRTAKQKAERVTLDKQPIELVAAYNAMDTYTTFKLYEKQKQCLV